MAQTSYMRRSERLEKSEIKFNPEQSSIPKLLINHPGSAKKEIQAELKNSPKSRPKRRRSESEALIQSNKKAKVQLGNDSGFTLTRTQAGLKKRKSKATTIVRKKQDAVKARQDEDEVQNTPQTLATKKRGSSGIVAKSQVKQSLSKANVYNDSVTHKNQIQRDGAAANPKRNKKAEKSQDRHGKDSPLENKKQMPLQNAGARTNKKRPRTEPDKVGSSRKLAKVQLLPDAELELCQVSTQAEKRRRSERGRKSTTMK
jgi:hypothetical protein